MYCIYIGLNLCLSILTAIFQVHLSAGTRMSPFWILLELRVMEVVVTTGAIRRVKLQSDRHRPQTNIQFFYRPDILPVTQPTVSKHWTETIRLSLYVVFMVQSYVVSAANFLMYGAGGGEYM